MKTLELTTTQKKSDWDYRTSPTLLTIGKKPVAIFLPGAEAGSPLEQYEQVIVEEPVLLTIGGKPVAEMLPLVPLVPITEKDIDIETAILSTHPKFLSIIERSRVRHKTEGGISSEEMRRRFGQSI